MKVILNTSNTAFVVPGGGEVQLLETYKELQKIDDCDVMLYNMWEPRLLECDLVHFFSVQYGSGVFCDFVKKNGIKLVVSPIIWLEDNNNYNIEEIKHILDIADFILPNSNAEIEMLNHKLNIPKDKMLPVYNAISSDFYYPNNNVSFKDEYKVNKYILNVANIEPRKNQLNLIKAIQNIGVELVLIGGIRDNEYYNECISADKNKLVHYIGRLDHDSLLLKSAYKEAECFVLPSTLETPGLAALEALVCRCPHIVVTSIGSAKEYFGNRVQYIDDINNVTKIERAIKIALAQPRIEESFVQEVQSKFTWQNTALQTFNAYKMAMNYVKPDIYNNNEFMISGFYDIEYDGINYFRWMNNKAYIVSRGITSKIRLTFVAERGQFLYIKYNKCKYDYMLEEGLNIINIEHNTPKVEIELESIKKQDIPKEEIRYLSLRFLKIEYY